MAALPQGALYALATFIGWITYRSFPYRAAVVRENLTIAFPELDERGLQEVMRRYYAGFADVLVEIVISARLTAADLRQRVHIANLDLVRAPLSAGQSVLIVAAHQCNWEWFLLALSRIPWIVPVTG